MSFRFHAFTGSNAVDRQRVFQASNTNVQTLRTLDMSVFPNDSNMSDIPRQYSVLGHTVPLGTVLSGDSTVPLSMNGGLFTVAVQQLTTGGTMTVTGTSVTPGLNTPVYGDTESLNIQATGGYRGSKRWVEVTSIDVTSGGITGIQYQPYTVTIAQLPYDIRIAGYVIQAVPASGTDNIAFRIETYSGGPSLTIRTLEDISADSGTKSLTDMARSGAFDRSLTLQSSADLFANRQAMQYVQTDYPTFCASTTTGTLPSSDLVTTTTETAAGANIVRCKSNDEGFAVTIYVDSGTIQSRLLSMQIRLYYEILN